MHPFLQATAQAAWEVAVEPALTSAGLYEAPDRAYGRLSIPFSPMERRLHSNPEVDVQFGKVMLANGKDWVWYQIWQDSDPRIPRRGDILFVHGTGVHSGTLASHSRRYLKAGFRLIVPDLLSHGYSSGVHVYQTSMSSYTAGLHAVLHDVAKADDLKDEEENRTKWDRLPTFMLGLSFGGTVALHYAIDFPHSLRQSPDGADEIAIDGIIAVGPILGYSAQNVSVPPIAAEMIRFSTYKLGIGRLELVVPHKKALDKDPKVYKSLINEDQRSHQGAFRLGHLVCIDEGICRIHQNAKNIKHPIFLQQGGQDRVACHTRSISWIRRLASTDKRMTIYPVCQHVIYRKAKTEEEDLAGRIACVEDNVEWMTDRLSNVTAPSNLTSLDNISFFFGGDKDSSKAQSYSISERSSSWSSSTTTPLSPCFSETDEYERRDSIPDMSEVTPPLTPPTKEKGESIEFREIDANAIIDHPLLAKAHKSTLPTLARLAPKRAYRSQWSLCDQLRPYDITVARVPGEDEGDETMTTAFSRATKKKTKKAIVVQKGSSPSSSQSSSSPPSLSSSFSRPLLLPLLMAAVGVAAVSL